MPLSDKKRAELEEAAIEAGEDPAEVIAAAEEIVAAVAAEDEAAETDDEPAADKPEPAPIFAYLMAFFTADEIRETRGFGPGVDGKLYAGEWLAKHGGVLTPAQGAAPAKPAMGEEPA